jgi:hypothetical protein
LVEIQDVLNAQAAELREQHGGIQSHRSLTELVAKTGNAVDKATVMALEEQVFALHAEQLATGDCRGAQYVGKLVSVSNAALGSAKGAGFVDNSE